METIVSASLIVSAVITSGCAISAVVLAVLNARKLDLIHAQYNSRMDELITQVGLAKLAEGRQFERDKVGGKP